MKMEEMFASARWIEADAEKEDEGIIIRSCFEAHSGEEATLTLIGLGTFEVFINGVRVSEDLFLPLNSEYEKCSEPKGEELSFRIYAVKYDISKYISEGNNILCVHLGYGWYTGTYLWGECYKKYGGKKLIYRICLGRGESYREVCSSGEERWAPSYVKCGSIHTGERQDYTGWSDEILLLNFDDKSLPRVKLSTPVISDYLFTDCPPDRVTEKIMPTLIYKSGDYAIYDVGRNLSGSFFAGWRG